MTAEIAYRIKFQDKCLTIQALKGEALFTPQDYGIYPVMITTACWDGYVCEFEVLEGRLVLAQLEVGLKKSDKIDAMNLRGPILGGKTPKRKLLKVKTHRASSGGYYRGPRLFIQGSLRKRRPYFGFPEFRGEMRKARFFRPQSEMIVEETMLTSSYFYEDINLPLAFTGGLIACGGFIRKLYFHGGLQAPHKFREVHELVFEEGTLVSSKNVSEPMAKIRENMDGYDLCRCIPKETDFSALNLEYEYPFLPVNLNQPA